MDSVQETPKKRRKLDASGASSSQAYDSQNDSGDDLFDNYETVATLPLSRVPVSAHDARSASSFVTQPTQILCKPAPAMESSGGKPSVVQVPKSSPARPSKQTSPSSNPRANMGGKLANAMAPAGTSFRLPNGVTKSLPSQIASLDTAKNPVNIDSDDDDAIQAYCGGSSDEESQNRRADIKPSTFIQNAQKSFGSGVDRFQEITSKSFYKAIDEPPQRLKSSLSGSVYDSKSRESVQTSSKIATTVRPSSDIMASAYGGTGRRLNVKQSSPAKAQSIKDIDIDEVQDYQMREKVKRIRTIVPNYSVRSCQSALLNKKGNIDGAMDMLAACEEQAGNADLIISEKKNDLSPSPATMPAKAPAKQQIKAPNQTIHQKWATQALQKEPRDSSSVAQKPSQGSSPVVTKPKRRLVQGRKKAESPVVPSPKRSSSPMTVSDASDSGIGTEPEDLELNNKVLEFFNTCSTSDLTDIAAITEEVAILLLSQKPFENLNQVRQISSDTNTKKKSTKKPFGERIVDKCLEMWTGYEAVDKLVKRCEKLSEPIKEEMRRWGIDVFGTSKGGELELTDFEAISNATRDSGISGIGTPTSRSPSEDCEGDIVSVQARKHGFFPQPSILAKGIVLKDYQVLGINWLSLLFEKQLSCILADDMGLGKTCQVIAFLAHLLEKGITGPHLIVVPGSTLENWMREFKVFCPKLSVTAYYGLQKERPEIRAEIEESKDSINVVVTTYGIAKVIEDNKFLRRLKPVVCVYDEGHYLRNSKSAGYEAYMRISSQFRLLLTGTPLQNNLKELASLLGFILPSVFQQHSEDLEAIFSHKAKTTDSDESHAALLSAQRIARAKSMMTPFVLRRKKYQVLKHLPQKRRRLEYCDLSESQTEIYNEEKARALRVIEARAAGKKTGNDTSNVMMALRKASIHPLLFRRLYDDKILRKMSKACLREQEFRESNINLVYEDMTVMTDMELHRFCLDHPTTMTPYASKNEEWMDSGKVKKLGSLLQQYKEDGDRVLVFSQFVMVMDILEAVMETLDMRFFRLDGQTKIEARQPMIDQFSRDPEITVFLLSTKAGGAGINLACANKVVIFDSSFNPQDDIQAENRAHRVGQTREVEVVRLVARGTIEEQIHSLGETKLALDDRVAGVDEEVDGAKAEKRGAKMVEEMMVGQIQEETEKDTGEDVTM